MIKFLSPLLSLLMFLAVSQTIFPISFFFAFLFFGIIILIHLYLIILPFVDNPKKFIRGSKQKENINKHMKKLISENGRVSIWSRDMSWATEYPGVKELLRIKAKKNELELFVPSDTELTNELRLNGASAYCYGYISHSFPKARFTYFPHGNHGDRVAIGIKDKHMNHIIKYLSASDDPTFAVIEDLLEIVRKMTKNDGQQD